MTQKISLKTGTSLATFLDGVIRESVKSALHQKALQEKEKQAAAGQTQAGEDNSGGGDGGDTDLFGSENSGSDEGADQENASSKTMDDETEKLQKGDINADDIVDKLNAIRAGKSFKDDKIKSAMGEYIGSLAKAEKTALLAFLKGISQIVTGEVLGQQATAPKNSPSDVEMEKGQKQKLKHVQPNVIVGSRPKERVKGGSEDTSGPVPIVPKKK